MTKPATVVMVVMLVLVTSGASFASEGSSPAPIGMLPRSAPRAESDRVTAGFAFVREGDIWFVDLTRNASTRITESGRAFSPRLSPDGRWIAYLSARPSGQPSAAPPVDIRIAATDGGFDVIVGTSTGPASEPAWSGSARRLAFVADERLFVCDLGDGSNEQPTARVVAVGMSLRGIGVPRPAWSQNGDRLAVLLWRGGVQSVWTIDSDTGEAEPMGIELPIDTPLAYAPSGGLGVLMPAADGRTDLALASDGGGFRTLLGGVTEFAWSPDGTRLATRRLGGGLWVGDRVGHAARRVDGDAEPVVGWAWLPDGRLAWQTRRGIHVIDPGGAGLGGEGVVLELAASIDGVAPASTAAIITGTIDTPWRTQFEGVCGSTNCGPSSLGISMQYLGVNHSNDTIRRAINAEFHNGETICWGGVNYSDLRWYAQEHAGLDATPMYTGLTIDDLTAWISLGQPVVLLVHYRSLPGHEASEYAYDHFIVFQGIRPDGLVSYDDPAFYTSSDGDNKTMTQETLMKAWTSCVPGNPQRSGMAVFGNACSAPALTSPPSGTVQIGLSRVITPTWGPSSGCTPEGYNLRIKTTPDMDDSGAIVHDEIVSGASAVLTVPAERDGETLYWSVRACAPCTPTINGGAWGMPSTLRVLPGIVRLYDGVGYTGEVFTVTRLGLVSLVNLFDARARSVEMPDGWSMRLFKDSVVGPHACFQGRDSDLADDTYSDGSAVAGTASFAETFVSDDCPPVRDRLTFAPIILRPGCRNIVVNGEFEAEDGWILLNGAAFTSEIVHSGTRAMRIAPSEPTYYASASQVITIPVGFEAMLSYWVNPTCVDCDTADRQYVWIRDAAGAPHFLVNYTRDNDQMWIRREHDVSAFAGQSVRLFFSVYGDGSGETNVVYLDDVRIDACPR